ncbi:MAG TPA: M20/M25/M40 family metallo-hydrolase [Thermoanaerobaculaceae bacterium]|nr:M20/M25/M40 family metallo-hydrolase [Thermoanaerobaculaceae bacterium]
MSERMVRQFMEMVRIDSESGNEARFMEYLLRELRAMGAAADLDAYGNLIARFPAKGSSAAEAILLSCHGDTVKPGVGIEPALGGDGVIRSKGATILGADDKAGIAEVLEALRTAPVRPPVEFAVSRQEEVGLLGVRAMDFSRISARRGFLMDNDTLDTIVIGGPTYVALDVKVTGRASHAGMEPEKGINAIRAASKAIAALRLGRLDNETTANVGVIAGGLIRNGVPAECTFLAECRSGDHGKAAALAEEMARTIRAEVEAAGARVEIVADEKCRAVRIPEDAWSVRIAKRALATVGIDAKTVFITGFTDASIYNNHGIEMAVVGIGAQNEHSTEECVAVRDMENAAKMLVEVLRLTAG